MKDNLNLIYDLNVRDYIVVSGNITNVSQEKQVEFA